jgi:transketolase
VRTAFIEQLLIEARSNPRLFLVVGDLGFSVVEPFAKEFPDRFLNAGVAEQNMTGLAAGLASEGYHVFTYSIANFPTLRCYEQIRNDICYHGLPVTVVAVGAGLAYGNLGYSHHGLQDIALMRCLPGLKLLSPADPGEAAAAVRHLVTYPGPSYLRLGKAGEPHLHEVRVISPAPIEVRRGRGELAIAATGTALAAALAAADELRDLGVEAAVFSCPWLKPLCAADLAPLWRHRFLITLEEHLSDGGFGELVCRLAPCGQPITTLAVGAELMGSVGSQQALQRLAGISREGILATVRKLGFGA